LILSKNKTDNNVLFINASDLFVKHGKVNMLSDDNITSIVKLLNDKENIRYVAQSADSKTISDNNYDLSCSKYVETKSTKEEVDIEWINAECKRLRAKNNATLDELDKLVYQLEHGIF